MKTFWMISCLLLSIPQAFCAGVIHSTSLKQYECLSGEGEPILSYFHPRNRPAAVPYSESDRLTCHDVHQYGPEDNTMYPRLKEQVASFKLWDPTHPLFYDLDADGLRDINGRINRDINAYGRGIPANTNWFHSFQLPQTQLPMEDLSANLGYYMNAFIDQYTFRSYCPQNHHYFSSNPIFKVLGRYFGTETEGLYIGVRMRGKRDFLFIRESELKKKWFYLRNGVPSIPTEDNVSYHSIFFVQDGEVFQVKSAEEIGRDPESPTRLPSGAATSYPTHDRKIGCVPKE